LETRIVDVEDEARIQRARAVAAHTKLEKADEDLAAAAAERDKMREAALVEAGLRETAVSEMAELHASLAEANAVLAALRADVQPMRHQIDALEADKRELEQTLASVKKQLEEVLAIPNAHGHLDVGTQTKKYAKTRAAFQSSLQADTTFHQMPAPPAAEEIGAVRAAYAEMSKALGGETAGLTIVQYERLKSAILAENRPPLTRPEEIRDAQSGSFGLDGGSGDAFRLLAQTVMNRVMERATRVTARREAFCQATVAPPPKISAHTLVQPSDFIFGRFSDAFTRLLDPHYADRPPRTFEWIMKSLRSVFDEKTLKDAVDAREGRGPSSMPEFTLQWATRQYGLDYLSQQCCWDLINSARAHRAKASEVELFRQFLDADLSTEQLTFFLRARAMALRRGITIPAIAKDSAETYNEVILTAAHATELVRRLFEKAGQELIDITLRHLRDEFMRKPAPTVDPSLSYLSMATFLTECVITFSRYELLELRKMIQMFELTPKLEAPAFTRFMRSLIPSLTEQELGELFQANQSHIVGRASIKKGRFRRRFGERSLLTKENGAALDGIGTPPPALERVRGKWGLLQPRFEIELEAARGSSDPALTHAVQCLRIEMDRVGAALTCHDVVAAHTHLLSCIMGYQSVAWVKSEPDVEVIDAVTASIREILRL
jgi:hypothetical protein